MRKPLSSVIAALGILIFASASLAAKMGDIFSVEDMEWRAMVNGKPEEAPEPNGGQETENGWCFRLFVDPDTQDESEGLERGLFFYREQTGRYSFLPFEEESVNDVHFSPDGEMFIVEGAGEYAMYDFSLELFDFDGFKSQFKTMKAAFPPQWLDVRRFAFSRFEPGTSRGRPDDYPDEWMSIAMYDATAGEEVVLKAATQTEEFMMDGFDDETGELVIIKFSVRNEKDWADEEKQEVEEMRVSLPAAG